MQYDTILLSNNTNRETRDATFYSTRLSSYGPVFHQYRLMYPWANCEIIESPISYVFGFYLITQFCFLSFFLFGRFELFCSFSVRLPHYKGQNIHGQHPKSRGNNAVIVCRATPTGYPQLSWSDWPVSPDFLQMRQIYDFLTSFSQCILAHSDLINS